MTGPQKRRDASSRHCNGWTHRYGSVDRSSFRFGLTQLGGSAMRLSAIRRAGPGSLKIEPGCQTLMLLRAAMRCYAAVMPISPGLAISRRAFTLRSGYKPVQAEIPRGKNQVGPLRACGECCITFVSQSPS